MTAEQITKAVAELDGCPVMPHFPGGYKPYLSSRDAIIPVIERQGNIQLIESSCVMKYKLRSILEATPAQLCETLLRATNKWIEE